MEAIVQILNDQSNSWFKVVEIKNKVNFLVTITTVTEKLNKKCEKCFQVFTRSQFHIENFRFKIKIKNI